MTETTDLRNPDAVCSALGLTAPGIWRETWPQSARSFELGKIIFLKPRWVHEACQTLGFAPGVTEALVEAAVASDGNSALERLLWHCRWLICDSGYDPKVEDWPEMPEALGPAGLMFYGLLTLSGLPHMQRMHAARGIPMADTIESLASLEVWIQDYKRLQGTWRFPRMGWLQHHLRGHLYKLGRLEYLPGSYYHPFRWYRHIHTDQVIALAEDGCLFRGDGQFASADCGEVCTGLWKSRLEETLDEVTGHPACPSGSVMADLITLQKADWQEVMRKGDPVITVHIPAKGPMDSEACGASFRYAVEFYTRHFPDLQWRAFTCNSWLLDPQFELLKPPPPNIVAFLQEWYLHPVERANDRGTWERVFDLFGHSTPDPDAAPQDTSLQRAVVAFMRQGGHLRGSGSVLFPEDLAWGQQVYRRQMFAGGN